MACSVFPAKVVDANTANPYSVITMAFILRRPEVVGNFRRRGLVLPRRSERTVVNDVGKQVGRRASHFLIKPRENQGHYQQFVGVWHRALCAWRITGKQPASDTPCVTCDMSLSEAADSC